MSLAVKLARRRRLQLLELPFAPVLLIVVPRRLLAFQGLLCLNQARVARVLRNGVVLLLPAEDLDIIFMGQGDDIAAIIVLRPAGAPEDLLRRAGIHQPLLAKWPF